MSLGIGAWGGRNLVQTVRDAGDGPMTVSAVQCLVEEDNRDPGFVANVTLRTESVERLEATPYGPRFFGDDFHRLGRYAFSRAGAPTGSPDGDGAAGKRLGCACSRAGKRRQGHRLA